jgi:hypothetical protein
MSAVCRKIWPVGGVPKLPAYEPGGSGGSMEIRGMRLSKVPPLAQFLVASSSGLHRVKAK